jgi:hypothetical protein
MEPVAKVGQKKYFKYSLNEKSSTITIEIKKNINFAIT